MKLATFALLLLPSLAFAADTDWPVASREAKPWIQWPSWSILSDSQITEALGLVKTAGFGGIVLHQQGKVEKAPDFLSSEWLESLNKVSNAAAGQDLGVDWSIFAASDWKLASALNTIDQEVEGGTTFKIKFPTGKVEALRAYSDAGKSVNLASQVKRDQLTWKVPAGKWRLLGLFSSNATGKDVLDPFSSTSTKNALKRIDQVFAKNAPVTPLRAAFHPSIDSTGPVWTSGLLEAFSSKRGYDLREQLPAFFGIGEPDAIVRVRADYRQTLDELYRSHLQAWQDWAVKKKILTRLQTQDALGNIIDQASIVDIPEVKIGRPVTADQFPQLLFAPSAAHLSGKQLVAASIDTKDLQLKQTVDLLWLAGINQVILDHSSAPFLTSYMTRCQSYLQAGTPHAELLLYYPEADLWNQPTTTEEAAGFEKSSFYQTAIALWKAGIAFDVVSDSTLEPATVADGQIVLKNRTYKALILPEIRTLPEATAVRLENLTKKGFKLGLTGALPTDVPGFNNSKKRAAALVKTLEGIPAEARVAEKDPVALSRNLGVRPDTLSEAGVQFTRRDLADGSVYFLVNPSSASVDKWIPLSVPFTSAVLLDPTAPDRTGIAPTRNILGSLSIHLTLSPGESRVIRTYTDRVAEGNPWKD